MADETDGISETGEAVSASARERITTRLLALRDDGISHARSGNLPAGIASLTAAVSLARESFGEEEWATRAMRIQLADLLAVHRDHRAVIRVLVPAMQAWPSPVRTTREMEALGDCSFQLGAAHDALAENADASLAYARAFKAYEQVLAPDARRLVLAASNVAEMARMRHDVAEAERWFRRAEALEAAARGEFTEVLALIRNNLGEALVHADRVAEGIALIVSALRIRFRTGGRPSSSYARSLSALGAAEGRRGRLGASLKALRRANDTYCMVRDRRGMTSSGMMLSQALGYDGQLDQAIASLRVSLPGVRDQDFGGREYLDTYVELAKLYMLAGRYAEARAELLHALDELNDETLEVAQTSSQRHLRDVVQHARDVLNLLAAATVMDAGRSASDLTALYREVQRRKGIETRWMRLQQPNAARAGLMPDQVAAREALRGDSRAVLEARQRLVRAQLDAAGDDDRAELRKLVDGDAAAVDALEATVARRSATLWMQYDVTGDLQVSVAPQDAIVEYLRIDVAIGNPAREHISRHFYVAFVLRAAMPLTLHDLGSATDVDAAIDTWRTAIIDPPATPAGEPPPWRTTGAVVYDLLLAPLAAEIASASHLFVAADAKVHEVAFSVLPVSVDELVLDRMVTSVLLAGSEYRREQLIIDTPLLENEPVVIVAPHFGAMPTAGAGDWVPFDALASTHAEGEIVRKAIGGTLLSGAAATAEAVAALVSPEILHIATHSFTLPHAADVQAPPRDLLEARSRLSDPMERCGVALTGANAAVMRDAGGGGTSGMLFGSDFALMDMRKTDLVCLSSCVSGLGDVEAGEGLLGLRRAFKAAGAHSVVCSLWPVPDDATRQLMSVFYAQLSMQRPRAEALRAAMLEVRKSWPDDPFCWAAFVLDGATTPLLRFSPVARLRVASIDARAMEALTSQWANALHDAEARHRAGDDDTALNRMATILASDGATDDVRAAALILRSAIHRLRHDLASAESDCSAALALDITPSRRAAAAYARGIARLMGDNWRDADADFTAVLALLDDGDSDAAWRILVLVNRSMALMHLRSFDAAVQDLDAVLNDPRCPESQRMKALSNRGECARLRGDAESMRRDWTAAVAIDPSPEPSLKDQLMEMLAMSDAESTD